MGFIIEYRPFFSVALSEEGSGEDLGQVHFFPTARCLKYLNQYNLVFRPRPAGFEVFYAVSPSIEISDQLQFTFGFRLHDSDLFLKYGLDEAARSSSYSSQCGLFFDNLDAGGSLLTANPSTLAEDGAYASADDTYHITRPTFEVIDPRSMAIPSKYHFYKYGEDESSAQTIDVYDNPDLDYAVTTINAKNESYQYFSKSGQYILKADISSVPDRRIYLNEELGRKSVQGVVDIYWENFQGNIPDSNGQKYNIKFKYKTPSL